MARDLASTYRGSKKYDHCGHNRPHQLRKRVGSYASPAVEGHILVCGRLLGVGFA
jgi:hypothetical protein